MINNKNLFAVIMAGGSGTRLWPLSRTNAPKQFQAIVSDRTLIQETYDRLTKVVPKDQIYIATIAKYKGVVLQQIPGIGEDHLILEPSSKNSGPSMGYFSAVIAAKNPQAVIATAPSDHVINNAAQYIAAYSAAFSEMIKNPGKLLTIGIKPDKPNIGLGYLKIGKIIDEVEGHQVYEIDEFKEKPDLKTATEYIKSWQYLWNSACYFWHATDMVKWLEGVRPEMMHGIKKIVTLIEQNDKDAEKEIKKIYNSFENEQIEYALVEQMKGVLTIPADLGWDDVGSWNALQELLAQKYDAKIISKGNHIDYDSEDVLVYSTDKLIATVGLKDVVVVDSPDALLVMNKEAAQDIKKLLEKLKKEGKNIYL